MGVRCLLVCLLAVPMLAGARDLELSPIKLQVEWSEPIALRVLARNPLAQTVTGTLTISFSGPVVLMIDEPDAEVFYEGDEYRRDGNGDSSRARQVTLQVRVPKWEPHATHMVEFVFLPLRTGRLEARARIAFLPNNGSQGGVLDRVPRNAPVRDQDDQPVYTMAVEVIASPEFMRNLARLVAHSAPARSQIYLRHLQNLITDPANPGYWQPFGFDAAPDNSLGYFNSVKALLTNANLLDDPRLMTYLHRLVANPNDREAQGFFGITILSEDAPDTLQQEQDEAARSAERYLNTLRGGPNLLFLLAQDRDFAFIPGAPDQLSFWYQGANHEVARGADAVLAVARKVFQLNPHAEFATKTYPAAGGQSLSTLIKSLAGVSPGY